LRVAADTTANPKLRIALDQVADDADCDEERLAEALEALERAEQKKR
jgi:hypothetical protein